MTAPFRRSMKTPLAMLCVALSFVFASASTASVINNVQHQAQPGQHHDHVAFSAVAFGDHHQANNAADVQEDEPSAEHQPGTGHHHHGDGPAGILATVDPILARPQPGALLLGASDDRVPTRGSPGPDRPPKRLTTSA